MGFVMAHRVCISQSESFLEISAWDQNSPHPYSQRYYLPKISLRKSLADFWTQSKIEKVERVFLNIKNSRTILKRRLGHSPTFLVTEGFENWFDMNLPIKTRSFTLNPSRVESLLDSDWVFGVKERTSATGEVISEVQTEELDFLAAKLELTKNKNICIGFLHSSKNPQNENRAKDYFVAKGFQVFTSHEYAFCKNERQRWLTAILNGYLAPHIHEQLSQYFASELLSDPEMEIEIVTGEGFKSRDQFTALSSLVGDPYLLQAHASQNEVIYYFGFDEFLSVESSTQQDTLSTELGPAAISSPKHEVLPISPTHVLQNDFWGLGAWSDSAAGYEPGPICIGRGLQPTFLDVLSLYVNLEKLEPLQSMLIPQNKRRILEALHSFSKDLKQEWSQKELIESLLRLALTPVVARFPGDRPIVFAGPFASAMKAVFQQLFKGLNISLDADSDFKLTRAPLWREKEL